MIMKNNYISIFTFCLVSVFLQAQTDVNYEFNNSKDSWVNSGQVATSVNPEHLTITVTATGSNAANHCKFPLLRSPDGLDLIASDYAAVRIRMKNNSTKANLKIAIHPTAGENQAGVEVLDITDVGTEESDFVDRDIDLTGLTATTINRIAFKGNDYSAHCGDTFDIDYVHILTNASLSTTEFSQDQFLIKNNPVSDKIQIVTFNDLPVIQLNLYDLSGKLIKTISNSAFLDVSELNSGLYLLNIHSELGQMTKKIIKK